tara:strand:- start:6697 stop:6885 length:189 start_codon:yes stop_codon:yes gene_type:complete
MDAKIVHRIDDVMIRITYKETGRDKTICLSYEEASRVATLFGDLKRKRIELVEKKLNEIQNK